MERLGKVLILGGIGVVIAGIIVLFFGDKLRFLGRLPGDLRYETEKVKIYFPVMTMILVSVILSFIMWVIQKLR